MLSQRSDTKVVKSRFDFNYRQFKALMSANSLIRKRQADALSTNLASHARLSPLLGHLLLFTFIGGATCISLFLSDIFTALSMIYTVLMLVLIDRCIQYFTSQIISARDNRVMLSLPLGGATLLLARLATSFQYFALITTALAIVPFILLVELSDIVTGMVFLLSLLPVTLLTFSLALLVLVLAMRIASPEGIKKALVGLYLLLVVVVIVAANGFLLLVNEGMTQDDFMSASLSGSWMLYYPPTWMAASVAATIVPLNAFQEQLFWVGVIVPFITFFIVLLLLGRKFTTLLLAYDSYGGSISSDFRSPKRHSQSNDLNPQHLAFKEWTNWVMSRDIGFKFRVYPVVVMTLVLIASAVFLSPKDAMRSASETGDLGFYFYLFLSTGFITTAIAYLQYGESHKAAWIFRILPVASPGIALAVLFKVFVWRWVLPINLMVLSLSYAKWGSDIFLEVICASLFSVIMCIGQVQKLKTTLFPPFAQPLQDGKVPSNNATIIFTCLWLLPFALLQYATKYFFGNLGLMVIMTLLLVSVYFYYCSLLRIGYDRV